MPKDELKQQLKMKASNERFIELREGLHKLQVMSISNQDKHEKEMKKFEVELAKKTMQLENLMQEVNMRVKSLEEELNEDDLGEQKSDR